MISVMVHHIKLPKHRSSGNQIRKFVTTLQLTIDTQISKLQRWCRCCCNCLLFLLFCGGGGVGDIDFRMKDAGVEKGIHISQVVR